MTRYRDYTTPTANIQLSMYYNANVCIPFYRHISAGKNLNIQFLSHSRNKSASIYFHPPS
nr:MAG TPA: hypothetical protein [Caudoviricetes sp.]